MRIAWIARCPTPYRYPIWESISQRHDLRVLFLQERGIGRTWRMEPRKSFTQKVLSARGPKYREDGLWFLMPGWKAYLRNVDAVVMQGLWETPAAWQIALWCRLRGVSIVYFSESTLDTMHRRGGPLGAARGFYMRHASVVLTPGKAATEATIAHGVPSKRVVTSINVIDVDKFHRETATARLQDPAVAASAPHHFLVVSRLVSLKNVASALEALSKLGTDATMEVVGDGPEMPNLVNLASSLGLSSRVSFSGQLDQEGVIARLALSHTLVLPSTEEVWGLVVNEALAAGLHVVVSDKCGVAKTVQRHRGVYVSAPDSGSLADAMSKSATSWRGWIENPEILTHDAERFASDFERALSVH